MLRITVTLIPGGDESRAREIASATIANASSLSDVSSYQVLAAERASDVTGLPDQSAGFGIVDHDRKQSVWSLVMKAAARAAVRFNRKALSPIPEREAV